MSPRRRCGRPRRPWTHRQKRQLVRLYTLTTLSNAEILSVLEGEGFSPSERHVQMQLRSLYSKEYVEDLHELRPRTDSIMRSRLSTMRQSRSSRISKAARYSRIKLHSKTISSRPSSATVDAIKAFRNYDKPITQDLQNYLSQCTLLDSQPTSSVLLMLDGSTASNQPIMDPSEPQPPRKNCVYCEQLTYNLPVELTLQLLCGHVCHERCLFIFLERHLISIPRTCPSCDALFALDPTSGIDPGKLKATSNRTRHYDQVVEHAISTDISARKTPDEEDGGIDSNLRANILHLKEHQKSEDDFDVIGKRLQNRSPSYIEHVTSVKRLSLSESYRTGSSLGRAASSLGWTVSSRSSWMSMSSVGSKSTTAESTQMLLQIPEKQPRRGLINSGRRMFYKVAAPLVKGERDIWNEIVDEAQLLPAPESRPANPEKELFDRGCPGELDAFDKSCGQCGYAIGWYHWHPSTGDYKTLDSLGNTKLHYAAASGVVNLYLIRLLIDNGVDLGARNSSGETFMHILKTEQFIESHALPGYLVLLRLLSNLDFPFFQRDFHGRTIAHSFSKDSWALCFRRFKGRHCSSSQLLEVLKILKIDVDTLDNHGFNVGDEILHSAEKYANEQKLDTSQAMDQLKEVVDCFRVPWRLKISFREALAKSDWTPSKWLNWLQEADLITWIDTHGDTPLTALLKNQRSEDQQAALSKMITKLVKLGVDVNMRDRKGHTAIAIAAIRGSLSCVQALLDSGASVNTTNYHGRDTISMASWRMKMAKHEGKTQCYARILACVNLLMDRQLTG